MKRRAVFCLMLAAGLAGRTAFAAGSDKFSLGREAFENGQFSDAAKLLRASFTNQPASGTLLNLGLAEWRRGRAGPAIQAWEQALWIDPGDGRARQNLEYARRFVGVESPDYTWYERASTWLPVNAWAWIAGWALWLAVGMMVVPAVLRWRRAAWHQAVAALSCAVFLLSLPAHYGVVTRTRLGFVLKKDTPLRLTPTAEAESLVKLNAGQPVRQVRVRGDYVFVQSSHGEGWIELGQIGSLCGI